MDYPGWTVETTHPTDPADPAYCEWCEGMIAPAIAFATDWGSTAHGAVEYHPEGTEHRVTVRAV